MLFLVVEGEASRLPPLPGVGRTRMARPARVAVGACRPTCGRSAYGGS